MIFNKIRIANYKLYVTFLLLLSIFIWDQWKNRKEFSVIDIKVNELNDLSLQELEYLNNFFHYVMKVSGCGYTLLGDKPMSIEVVNKIDSQQSIEGFDYMAWWNILNKYRLLEGWNVWKKYSNRFELKGYTLRSYPPNEDGFEEIFFINHKNFVETIKNNYQDFRIAIGKEMSPDEILDKFISDQSFYNAITSHEGLFGTILGYGRNNAWEFLRRYSLSPNDESKLERFSNEWFAVTSYIMFPMFMALPDTEETKHLYNVYSKQRKTIKKYFADGDFTTPTLRKITGREI